VLMYPDRCGCENKHRVSFNPELPYEILAIAGNCDQK
jgi:hypothetical protein